MTGIETLRGLPLFAGLDDDALAAVAEVANEAEYPAGQVLIEPRMKGYGMIVIVEGTAIVDTHEGSVEVGPGDFVGELALLTDQDRTARVRAKTPVRFLAIARDDFQRMLDREPRIAVAMLRVLAHRFVGRSAS